MKRLKLAMVVVDANDVVGAAQTDFSRPGPVCHTAVEALLDGLSMRDDLECHVVYGNHRISKTETRERGSLIYTAVPYKPWRVPGMGGAFVAKFAALQRFLRQLHPDVVHGQGTEREAAMVAVKSGRPSILTLHGNMAEINRQMGGRPFSYLWTAAKLEDYAVKHADAAICLSDYSADVIRPLAKKTFVVCNPVDRSFFDIPRQKAQRKTLICIGHISQRKNQVFFLRAIRSLAEEMGVRIVFAGGVSHGNAYAEEFLSLVKENPWAEYLGLIDRACFQKLLSEASGLILPSLEDNCPMVLLEAMAAGTPVTGANVGGIPQILENGERGLLFDPRDAESIRGACRSLLSNAATVEAKAALVRDEMVRTVHPESIAAQHMNFYRQIVDV